MIIQIRGTSGSGKTHCIRQVIGDLQNWKGHYENGRRQPLYYTHKTKSLALLGHYESTCGGCDNVGSAARVFEVIRLVQKKHPGLIILCEGLLLSEDVKWSQHLTDLHVIYLNTPLNTCLKQIRARREAAGNDKPLNVANTANRVNVISKSRVKLTGLGVKCYYLAFQSAVEKILELINNA